MKSLAMLLLAAMSMHAQFVRGTLLGTVSDESGAVIAGASVTLKNTDTNETKTANTDESGGYTFPALLPGSYSIEVKQAGFKLRSLTGIRLEVNQTARVDVKLSVGEVSERIEVTANAVLLKTDTSDIDHVVTNKQIVELPLNGGYGRGGRMKIEKDEVRVTSGVRWGETLGSPITLVVENKDWKNWQRKMSVDPADLDESIIVTRPRPGHADLVGAIKYDHRDLRNVLERASARETTARVAAGALVRQILERFGVRIMGSVAEIGGIRARHAEVDPLALFAVAESIRGAHG